MQKWQKICSFKFNNPETRNKIWEHLAVRNNHRLMTPQKSQTIYYITGSNLAMQNINKLGPHG